MASIRVLCVTPYYRPAYIYGGPARSVPALCEALAREGADITVFTTNANGSEDLPVPPNMPVSVDGVSVYYFQRSHVPARYFYSSKLKQACDAEMKSFDIMYLCGTWTYPLLASAKAAHRSRVPYVMSPRGSFMNWSMSQSYIKKRIYLKLFEEFHINRAACLHCTSELEVKQMPQWGFECSVELIPNGIDTVPFQTLPDRGKLRGSLGISPLAPVTLFCGRLHKMKRLDRIVGAFSNIAADAPDAHLVITGQEEDGSGAAARELAMTLGISDRVHFTGLLKGEALLQAYADSDILVMLSFRENFGMAAVEGMAAGLPLLLSSDVGLADEVGWQGAGFVVEADSPEVEKAWLQLLRSPELRSKMSKAGMELANQRFSSQAVARQMLDLFGKIVNRK